MCSFYWCLSKSLTPALMNSHQTIQVDQQTMQVNQQCNMQFLKTVAAQQDQLHQCARCSGGKPCMMHDHRQRRPNQCSIQQLHASNQWPVKPQTHLETIAFPGILWFSKTAMSMNCSGAAPESALDREQNMLLNDFLCSIGCVFVLELE
jgi:hypothetical protein